MGYLASLWSTMHGKGAPLWLRYSCLRDHDLFGSLPRLRAAQLVNQPPIAC
jgi:hypothetical protein